MDNQATSGIEWAVFGAVARSDIDAWLNRHLRARLGGDLSHIMFRSGRVLLSQVWLLAGQGPERPRVRRPGREQGSCSVAMHFVAPPGVRKDRSGSEPIRQVPRATMPEPGLDHGRQAGGNGSVTVPSPADPARPAQAGAQPSRIMGLALAGLALAAGVVWVGRRRHPQARPTT